MHLSQKLILKIEIKLIFARALFRRKKILLVVVSRDSSIKVDKAANLKRKHSAVKLFPSDRVSQSSLQK